MARFSQVCTGDSWAESIARPLLPYQRAVVAVFFVSYIVLSSIVLINIVVAVLLDEFLTTMTNVSPRQFFLSSSSFPPPLSSSSSFPLSLSLSPSRPPLPPSFSLLSPRRLLFHRNIPSFA